MRRRYLKYQSSSWTEINFLKSSENFCRSKSVIIFEGGSDRFTENRITVGNSETKNSFEHFSLQRLQSTSANWISGKSLDAAAKTGLKRTDLGCRMVLKWTSQSHSRLLTLVFKLMLERCRSRPTRIRVSKYQLIMEKARSIILKTRLNSIQSRVDSKLRTEPRYCDSQSPIVPALRSSYS